MAKPARAVCRGSERDKLLMLLMPTHLAQALAAALATKASSGCSILVERAICRTAILAFGLIACYFNSMSERIRRISVLLLALTLAVGLVTHGVRAADMDVKMAVAAASDMATPDKCDGCKSDHDGMSPAACSAHCSGVIVMQVAAVSVDAPAVDIRGATAASAVKGHGDPPEPYPPRPGVLS
jgi:hypothetical protein